MTVAYGFLSTHPPTRCGLATFNAALSAQLRSPGDRGGDVVRIMTGADDAPAGTEVVHTWPTGAGSGWRAAAAAMNRFEVAVVQHEYGIYPGTDGHDLLPLLRRLTVPSIVVLHTVLVNPTAGQRLMLEKIVAAASAVVTMTDTARDRLCAGYAVDAGKVTVIPHGAIDRTGTPRRPGPRPSAHLLTWGLIGPGKGIEWAVRAVGLLRDLDPAPTYTIAGRTHPKVLEHQGEEYRTSLQRLGAELGISESVAFDPVYYDEPGLSRLIRSADIVVLPYDSREQVTSGVLIEAVAAGVPVVASAFPHAVELLRHGPGLLVPHQDPYALAAAIRRLLVEPGLGERLVQRTQTIVPTVLWSAVAERYQELAHRLLAAAGPSAPLTAVPV